MRKSRIWPSLFALAGLCFAFKGDDPVKRIIEKVKQFNSQNPGEKIHLHFDKPFYSTGDTVWFKAYLVNTAKNELSALSRVMYVDLVDERKRVSASLLLPVDAGTAQGMIVLPLSLHPGSYTVRAYTRWMRNAGEDFFFYKTIPIGNALLLKVNEAMPVSAQLLSSRQEMENADVRFFPEGGELVTGVRSKVAFKVTATNGLGIDAEGEILDNEEVVVAGLKADHAGMGVFALTPLPGKTYTARLITGPNTYRRIALPQAKPQGFVLSVNNADPENLLVTVSASAGMVGKEMSLIGFENNESVYAAQAKMTTAKYVTTIPTERFRTGLLQLTLFSADDEPVAERLVFIDRHDQPAVSLNIPKTSYSPGDSISMEIHGSEPGTYSISVTSKSRVPIDEENETTILSNLLLTSELKGVVERPNYYFLGNEEVRAERSRQLDNLLLTQGWRRFTWKAMLSEDPEPPGYTVETGLSINGKLLTLKDKPIANTRVSIVANKEALFYTDTLTHSDGRFSFSGIDFPDSTSFMLMARKVSNAYNVKFKMDTLPPVGFSPLKMPVSAIEDPALGAYLRAARAYMEEQDKKGLLDRGIVLDEVKLSATKNKRPTRIEGSSQLGFALPAHVILPEKIMMYPYLWQAFQGIAGITVRNQLVYSTRVGTSLSGAPPPPMAVYVDGMRVQPEMLNDITPGSVKGIEILTPGANSAIYGEDGYSGVVVITTKKGGEEVFRESRQNVKILRPRGYTVIREFFSPKYTPKEAGSDLRSTVYWNPSVLISESNSKTAFGFYGTAAGEYRVVLEGVDMNGRLTRVVSGYQVGN